MKCNSFVVTLACLLSTTFTLDVPRTPEDIHNHLVSYINGKIENIRTMYNSPCFEIFFPIFNGLADRAKCHSQVCRKNATSKLQSLTQRENDGFKEIVEKIENPLKRCHSSHGLGYFKCIADTADHIASYFKQIERIYAEILKINAKEMKRINEEELICLEQVVNKSKYETDLAYGNLQKCTVSGKWPSSTSSNNDQQQDDKEEPVESEDKTPDPFYKISLPIAIGVPIGLALTVSAILIGTLIYKSNKNDSNGQIMNAETNAQN